MKVREYLQNFPDAQEVTFIRQVAVKSEGAPGFHYEYRTTAIRCVWGKSKKVRSTPTQLVGFVKPAYVSHKRKQ